MRCVYTHYSDVIVTNGVIKAELLKVPRVLPTTFSFAVLPVFMWCVCHHKFVKLSKYIFTRTRHQPQSHLCLFQLALSSYSTRYGAKYKVSISLSLSDSEFEASELLQTDLLRLHFSFHRWIAGMRSKSIISGLCNCMSMRSVTVVSLSLLIQSDLISLARLNPLSYSALLAGITNPLAEAHIASAGSFITTAT